MQWNSDRNAGFSKAVPAKLYFPVIMDPIWGYQAINVEAQQSDASSLLHWTRNMIALRKIFQVFGRGTQEFLHPDNRKVLAYIRDYTSDDDGHSETVLCVANLSRFAQPVALDLSKFAGRQPVEMLGYVPFPTVTDQPYQITLAPYSFFWLELQPAPRPATPPIELAAEVSASTPTITRLLNESGFALIDSLLPAYIAKQRWFGGKSRTIRSARITSSTPIDATSLIAIVELTYDDASTDLYQLPLAIASADQITTLQKTSIIATLDDATILFDASASPTFQSALLNKIITTSDTGSELIATHSSALDPKRLTDVPARLGSAEQSNTSILYDELAILKLFRHIRIGENPDVEITRFLTEIAHFDHIPAYLGDLHRASDNTTIAFLQSFAPNQGDGWAWTLNELATFYNSVANSPAPTSTTAPDFLNPAAPSPEIQQHAATYLSAANLLGRRTAELHLALATPTDDPAFAAEPYSSQDLAEDRERIDRQVSTALNALQSAIQNPSTTLPPETIDLATELLSHREDLLARIKSLNGDAALFGQRIRIHGDYHLGQVLRAKSDFLIIDFEGEPARSLEARRHKQSPLRDVAGMLRSFSYAAHSAAQTATQGNQKTLEAWATAWENAASNAFLRGYLSSIAANPALLPQSAEATTALLTLLLEKAFYELLYELNNRPTWLVIPLKGLLALTRNGA
jgi:maltose alpha-D-glucosyltransferase / alpha-amylase